MESVIDPDQLYEFKVRLSELLTLGIFEEEVVLLAIRSKTTVSLADVLNRAYRLKLWWGELKNYIINNLLSAYAKQQLAS